MFYKRKTAKKVIVSGGLTDALYSVFPGVEQGLVGGMQVQVGADELVWFAVESALDMAAEGEYTLLPELIPQVAAALALPEVWEKRQLIPAACGFISTRTCDGLWRNDTQFLGRDPLDGLLRFSASGSYTYRICDNALFCASVRGGAVPALCSGIEAQLSACAAEAFVGIIADRPLHLRSLDAQCLELAEELRLQLEAQAAQLGLAVPQMQLQLHLAESSKPMLDAAYPQQACFNARVKEVFGAAAAAEE